MVPAVHVHVCGGVVLIAELLAGEELGHGVEDGGLEEEEGDDYRGDYEREG